MGEAGVPRLSRLAKLFYGAGDTGFSITYTALDFLFAKFLLDVVGLPAALAAAAIFTGRTWDWINDPLVGFISDRTRTRWGRRRPFLLFGAIPFAVSFMLLWWVPPLANVGALAVYYGLAYFLFDAMATLVSVPLLLAGVVLAIFYPLSREQHTRIRRLLERKRLRAGVGRM